MDYTCVCVCDFLELTAILHAYECFASMHISSWSDSPQHAAINDPFAEQNAETASRQFTPSWEPPFRVSDEVLPCRQQRNTAASRRHSRSSRSTLPVASVARRLLYRSPLVSHCSFGGRGVLRLMEHADARRVTDCSRDSVAWRHP